MHLSRALSSAQGQMPSYVNKHSTPLPLHKPDAVQSRKEAESLQSAQHQILLPRKPEDSHVSSMGVGLDYKTDEQ